MINLDELVTQKEENRPEMEVDEELEEGEISGDDDTGTPPETISKKPVGVNTSMSEKQTGYGSSNASLQESSLENEKVKLGE